MSQNFINDLTGALERIIRPDVALLKEILIVGGMPEKTENLRYLGFNRHVVQDGEDRTLEFSAVAMLNNRRIDKWRLAGYKKKVSQVVFSSRWTRNPLDLFLNALRCDDELMDIIDSCPAPYTLLGILHIDEIKKSGFVKRLVRHTRPGVVVPGLEDESLDKIVAFEKQNEIVKSNVKGIGIYKKVGKKGQ